MLTRRELCKLQQLGCNVDEQEIQSLKMGKCARIVQHHSIINAVTLYVGLVVRISFWICQFWPDERKSFRGWQMDLLAQWLPGPSYPLLHEHSH